LDGAMKLYQQALEIKEGLGDLQGKSATLHNMAQIYVTRGDLDGAMKLYQQSLEIKEGLGDLKGKSATLSMMANINWARKEYDKAQNLMKQSIEISKQIGDFQNLAISTVKLGQLSQVRGDKAGALQKYQDGLGFAEKLGAKPLVAQIRQLISELEGDEQQQGMTAEQFITSAVQCYLQRKPEAQQYYEASAKMANDPNSPAELRTLGKALQRILIGDKHPDLSSLPKEWSTLITTLLNP